MKISLLVLTINTDLFILLLTAALSLPAPGFSWEAFCGGEGESRVGFGARGEQPLAASLVTIHSFGAGKGEQPLDLPACGLHPKTLDQLSQSPTLGKSSIRLLEMKDYAYTWKA